MSTGIYHIAMSHILSNGNKKNSLKCLSIFLNHITYMQIAVLQNINQNLPVLLRYWCCI